MEDKLYSFILRGELTKIALESSGVVSKHSSSESLAQEYIKRLSLGQHRTIHQITLRTQ